MLGTECCASLWPILLGTAVLSASLELPGNFLQTCACGLCGVELRGETGASLLGRPHQVAELSRSSGLAVLVSSCTPAGVPVDESEPSFQPGSRLDITVWAKRPEGSRAAVLFRATSPSCLSVSLWRLAELQAVCESYTPQLTPAVSLPLCERALVAARVRESICRLSELANVQSQPDPHAAGACALRRSAALLQAVSASSPHPPAPTRTRGTLPTPNRSRAASCCQRPGQQSCCSRSDSWTAGLEGPQVDGTACRPGSCLSLAPDSRAARCPQHPAWPSRRPAPRQQRHACRCIYWQGGATSDDQQLL